MDKLLKAAKTWQQKMFLMFPMRKPKRNLENSQMSLNMPPFLVVNQK